MQRISLRQIKYNQKTKMSFQEAKSKKKPLELFPEFLYVQVEDIDDGDIYYSVSKEKPEANFLYGNHPVKKYKLIEE